MKFAKTTVIFLLLLWATPSLIHAAFNIPGYVYRVSQLESAQRAAINSQQAITFLYTNKNMSCGLGSAASIDIFEGLKHHSIIVYAEKKDWAGLPQVVQQSLNSASAGKYIPRTVIMNANLDTVICIIPYREKKERQTMIRQAQGILASY